MIIFLGGTVTGMMISKVIDIVFTDKMNKRARQLKLGHDMPTVQDIRSDYKVIINKLEKIKGYIKNYGYTYDNIGSTIFDDMNCKVCPLVDDIVDKLAIQGMNVETTMKIYHRLLSDKEGKDDKTTTKRL